MISNKCDNCDGVGAFLDPHHGHGFKCYTCDGTGKVWDLQIEEVTELKEEDQPCCYGMMVAGNQHSSDCKEKV